MVNNRRRFKKIHNEKSFLTNEADIQTSDTKKTKYGTRDGELKFDNFSFPLTIPEASMDVTKNTEKSL